jgi:hypothetical protein
MEAVQVQRSQALSDWDGGLVPWKRCGDQKGPALVQAQAATASSDKLN